MSIVKSIGGIGGGIGALILVLGLLRANQIAIISGFVLIFVVIGLNLLFNGRDDY